MENADIISYLEEELKSPEPKVREQTIEELSNFTDNPEVIKLLVKALEDENRFNQDLVASILAQTYMPEVVEYLIPYLEYRDFFVRNLAISILKQIGDNFIDILVEALEKENNHIKLFIIEIINSFKNPEYAQYLLKYLDNDDPNIVFAVIEGLANLGINEVAPELKKLIEKTDEEALKIAAINALGKCGDCSYVDFLKQFLYSDNPFLMFSAIDALGFLGCDRIVDDFYKIFEDAYDIIKEMIIISLIRIGKKNNADYLKQFDKENVKHILLNAMDEDDIQIKLYAIEALVDYMDFEVLDKTLQYISENEIKDFVNNLFIKDRRKIASVIKNYLLDRTLSSDIVYFLINLLVDCNYLYINEIIDKYSDSDEPLIKESICFAIGKLGIINQKTKGLLSKFIKDEVGNVRKIAANAIGWNYLEEFVDELFALLDDPFIDVREAAIGALVFMGNKKVIDRFIELLNSEDDNLKVEAIKALGWIGVRDVIPVLEESLSSPNREIRKLSVEALARMDSKESAEKILQLLYDEDDQIKQIATVTLANFKYIPAIPHVISLLSDSNMWVRYIAARNLILFGVENVEEYVKQILASDDELAILGVLQSLEDENYEPFINILLILKDHQNSDISLTVNNILEKCKEKGLI